MQPQLITVAPTGAVSQPVGALVAPVDTAIAPVDTLYGPQGVSVVFFSSAFVFSSSRSVFKGETSSRKNKAHVRFRLLQKKWEKKTGLIRPRPERPHGCPCPIHRPRRPPLERADPQQPNARAPHPPFFFSSFFKILSTKEIPRFNRRENKNKMRHAQRVLCVPFSPHTQKKSYLSNNSDSNREHRRDLTRVEIFRDGGKKQTRSNCRFEPTLLPLLLLLFRKKKKLARERVYLFSSPF